MFLNSDLELEKSYGNVFQKAMELSEFDEDLLEKSRLLFDFGNSNDFFEPKQLRVNALVGGLEFSNALKQLVKTVQAQIDEIIQTKQRYWVQPNNLAIEYLVTKWPDAPPLLTTYETQFISYLKSLHLEKYSLRIKGFQVNPDGCIVLRGYEDGNILQVRDTLREKFDWLPKSQSGWAHIPIGRILCNVRDETYLKLVTECEYSFGSLFFEEQIHAIHYVHEHQWYMEKKSIIETLLLR